MAKRKKAKRKAPKPAKLNGLLRDHVFVQVNKTRAAQGVRISNLVQALKRKKIATTSIAVGKSVSLDPRMVSEGGYIRLATGPEKAGRIGRVELGLGAQPKRRGRTDAQRETQNAQQRGYYANNKRKQNIVAAVEVLDIVIDSKDLPAVARQKLLLTTRRLMTGEE